MKKITRYPRETPSLSTSEDLDPIQLSETAQRTVSARLRNPGHADPVSHVFTIAPNVDTPTLLVHASETLASLNAMTTDLAHELEGSRRNVALAIQQLTVLAELLVNQALDHLDTPDGASESQPTVHH